MIENFPTKKYNTLVIDPPWNITLTGKVNRRENRRMKMPYKIMSLKEIKSIPIKNIANKGSHIYLWATNKFLRKAFEVFDSWKVNFHLVLVWNKPSFIAPCMGYQFATEFCLLGFFDKPMQKFLKIGKRNHFYAPQKRDKHSTKPDVFYKLIEKMSPSPRIDLFARQKRKNWDVWGDEIG